MFRYMAMALEADFDEFGYTDASDIEIESEILELGDDYEAPEPESRRYVQQKAGGAAPERVPLSHPSVLAAGATPPLPKDAPGLMGHSAAKAKPEASAPNATAPVQAAARTASSQKTAPQARPADTKSADSKSVSGTKPSPLQEPKKGESSAAEPTAKVSVKRDDAPVPASKARNQAATRGIAGKRASTPVEAKQPPRAVTKSSAVVREAPPKKTPAKEQIAPLAGKGKPGSRQVASATQKPTATKKADAAAAAPKARNAAPKRTSEGRATPLSTSASGRKSVVVATGKAAKGKAVSASKGATRAIPLSKASAVSRDRGAKEAASSQSGASKRSTGSKVNTRPAAPAATEKSRKAATEKAAKVVGRGTAKKAASAGTPSTGSKAKAAAMKTAAVRGNPPKKSAISPDKRSAAVGTKSSRTKHGAAPSVPKGARPAQAAKSSSTPKAKAAAPARAKPATRKR